MRHKFGEFGIAFQAIIDFQDLNCFYDFLNQIFWSSSGIFLKVQAPQGAFPVFSVSSVFKKFSASLRLCVENINVIPIPQGCVSTPQSYAHRTCSMRQQTDRCSAVRDQAWR